MIKRLLLLFLLPVLVITVVNGQDYLPLVINPKVGVTFNNFQVNHEQYQNTLAKMGWNIGADVRYGTKWLAKGGLHFYKISGDLIPMDTIALQESLVINQIKIPVGIGLKAFRVDYFNIWIYVDGVFNYSYRTNQPASGDSKNRGTTFSGRAGVGIDLWRITIEANYERSFTELMDNDIEAKNKMVNVSIGIKF
jgi:hypothetical protein